jgi:hypothetical protein
VLIRATRRLTFVEIESETQRLVQTTSPAWLGWLAGIIDGEGTITITPRQRSDQSHASPTWHAIVRVANTDEAMIAKLRELTVSLGSTHKIHERRKNRASVVYHWHATSRQALVFLRAIRPYLVTKRRQADLAIAFCERVATRTGYSVLKTDPGQPFKGSQLSLEEVAARRAMYDEMKELNRKGRWAWQESSG